MGSGNEGQAAPVANFDSVRIILEYARQQYERIDARHESLVQRSSAFLGLLVVVVGLVAAALLHGASWRVFSLAGLAIVFVGIILFVKLTRLKTYEWTPDAYATATWRIARDMKRQTDALIVGGREEETPPRQGSPQPRGRTTQPRLAGSE
jgi:hypothetical protein